MSLTETIILVPCHSLEDFPTELGDEPAAGLLNAFAIAFHPALIATTGSFPRYRRADEAGQAQPGQLLILPTACKDWVQHGWADHARREGAQVVSGEFEREAMLTAALRAVSPETAEKLSKDLAADFMALGTVYLFTELLTRHMRNYSHLDEQLFLAELLPAARAALADDQPTARTHLRRCFEKLQDCREKFYPVDSYLLDLCLLIPRLANESCEALLRSDVPVNFLAQGCDWQEILAAHPDWQQLLTERWRDGQLDLLGGDWREGPDSLVAIDDVLANLIHGRAWYLENLGRAPTVWGRRRFGHGPHLPQLLTRLNYTGALHFVMDDGIYPDDEQAKFRWQGNDGSHLDACSRIPLAGDSASAWLRFPLRLSESMDRDHSAGAFIARWPEMRSPWLNDLRRAAGYAPVLGKFTTFEAFFRATDTHGALQEFKAGEYLSPLLVQSVARREADPISRYRRYWELHRQAVQQDWCRGLVEILNSPEFRRLDDPQREWNRARHSPDSPAAELDAALEQLEQQSAEVHRELARVLTAQEVADSAATPPQGVLIVNPLSCTRQELIDWPEGTVPPGGAGVLQRQVTDETARAIVEVPGCGFVWLPAVPRDQAAATPPGPIAMAEELLLRTDLFEVELSNVTGGIAQIRTYRRSPNRLSQQVAFRFPFERRFQVTDGEQTSEVRSYYSEMVLQESRILSAGPAVGCIETRGELRDQVARKAIASYVQRVSVYRGSALVRVELEITAEKLPEGDPWSNYYCCRFAWKNEEAALSGSLQEGTHLLTNIRCEAPHCIEIADQRYRTSLHFPGLPFHRKVGDRMLDTLLIVEGETARRFEFTIQLDDPFPLATTWRSFAPPAVIPLAQAPPGGVQSGWLFHVDAPNVLLKRLMPLPPNEAGDRSGGFVIRLQETEGLHKSIYVRCFATPSHARQLDFRGETIGTIPIENDAMRIEIAAYEVCDVEVRY
jgi:alpha-mannosidase